MALRRRVRAAPRTVRRGDGRAWARSGGAAALRRRRPRLRARVSRRGARRRRIRGADDRAGAHRPGGELHVVPGRPPRTGARGRMISIAGLYPELLGTYGDGGNVAVLAQRLRWRGVDVETVTVA